MNLRHSAATQAPTCQGGRDGCVHSCGDSREANVTHEPARGPLARAKEIRWVQNSLEREAFTAESVSADAKGSYLLFASWTA